MKILFKSIVTIFVLYCLLNSAQSNKIKRAKTSFWLFEDFLNWASASLTFKKIDNVKDLVISGKSNIHINGIYFTGLKDEDIPKVEKLIYPHELKDEKAAVIDFIFVEECNFSKSTSWSGGSILNFKVKTNDGKAEETHDVKIRYSLVSNLFKSDILTKKISEITTACKNRQTKVQEEAKKQAAEEARQKAIEEELKAKDQELKKLEAEQDKKIRLEKFNKILAQVVKDSAEKIKLAEDKAVKESAALSLAQSQVIGPTIVLECPSIASNISPHDIKLTSIKNLDQKFKKNNMWPDSKNRIFQADFDTKTYTLSLKSIPFSSSTKAVFSAGTKYHGVWSNEIEVQAETLTDDDIQKNIIRFKPVFKDLDNWCGKK